MQDLALGAHIRGCAWEAFAAARAPRASAIEIEGRSGAQTGRGRVRAPYAKPTGLPFLGAATPKPPKESVGTATRASAMMQDADEIRDLCGKEHVISMFLRAFSTRKSTRKIVGTSGYTLNHPHIYCVGHPDYKIVIWSIRFERDRICVQSGEGARPRNLDAFHRVRRARGRL